MLNHIKETKEFLNQQISSPVEIGIILGSGLGELAEEIDKELVLDYKDIPHFLVSTVEGHKGQLIVGTLNGVRIIALQGRFHYYEGYDMKATAFPIRVLKALGVETLLLSNASGGLNPEQQIGDLMVITDHIHSFADNPLRGKNHEELGPRFPDMSEPYSNSLIAFAKTIDKEQQLKLKYGVYLGTSGPTYETKSEYKYFRHIGADAVGMSTTPETIVAVHSDMKVFAVSVIADMGVEGQIVEISHEEVQEVAAQAAPRLSILVKEMVKAISVSKETI